MKQAADEQKQPIRTKTIQGKFHSGFVELDEELGVVEGQEVENRVLVIPKATRKAGEGRLRTKAAVADDTEWDAIMEQIDQPRYGGLR